MSSESKFYSSQLSEFARDLYRTAEEKFPAEVKKFMRGQGNKGTRYMTSNIRAATKKKTGNLLRGVNKSSVYEYEDAKGNKSFQIRVRNSAPHAHLLESGHEIWLPEKQKDGSYKAVDQERRTEGTHFATKAADKLMKTFESDVDKFVDKMLEKGLRL